MTGRLVTGKRDRRQHIATAREMVANFDAAAGGHEEEKELSQAELWWRRASTIRWLLGYAGRHVNLETGELTISLEPEEAA